MKKSVEGKVTEVGGDDARLVDHPKGDVVFGLDQLVPHVEVRAHPLVARVQLEALHARQDRHYQV
jgi:hypothetical protein